MSGKRRSKGEGGVYQRESDGRWVGVLEMPSGGRRKRKYVYAATKQVAERRLRALRVKMGESGSAPDDRMTVGKWLDRWCGPADAPGTGFIAGLAPKTVESYSQIVRDYIRPELGRVRLAELTTLQVDQALSDLARRKPPVPPATIGYTMRVLRIALGAAQAKGVLRGENPATKATAPKYEKRKARPFTAKESMALMAAIKQDRLYPLIVLALTAALRRGELLGLTWGAVNLEERFLRVEQQLQRQKGKGLITRPTKTERSEAPVALTDMAIRALQAHRGRLVEERMALGTAWEGNPNPVAGEAFVFVSEMGKPIDPDGLRRRFLGLLEQADLALRGPHQTRHTTATLLGALKVPPAVIAAVLRHSKVTTTLNVYTQADLDQQREAAAKLDELLGGVLA